MTIFTNIKSCFYSLILELSYSTLFIIIIAFPAAHMSGLGALLAGLYLHPTVASGLFLPFSKYEGVNWAGGPLCRLSVRISLTLSVVG